MLSLVSKEHCYVEGPPGIGKTALAEAACMASGRRSFFAQLHRDTRLSELIGDAVIRREACEDGEVIRARRGGGGAVRPQYQPGGGYTEVTALGGVSRRARERSSCGEFLPTWHREDYRSRAEMMSLVVALSRSSCAPRLRGVFEGK